MSKLDEFFANKNWEFDDEEWNYTGNEDPQECVKELRQLQYDAALQKINEDTNIMLMDLNTKLRAALDEAKELLLELQWIGDDHGVKCRICFEDRNFKHKPDCKLKAWLEKYGGLK